MKRKQMRNIGLYLLAGAIVGGLAAFMIEIVGSSYSLTDIYNMLIMKIQDKAIAIGVILYIIGGIVPYIFLMKGKKVNQDIKKTEDEEKIDAIEKRMDTYLNLGMLFNSTGVALYFMYFGLAFTLEKGIYHIVTILIIFLVATITASAFEVIYVNFIRKNDSRLKGDPSTKNFRKEFVNSLDEKEKTVVYKSGYEAFNFSRGCSIVLLLLAMFYQFSTESGSLVVIIAGINLLAQNLSYCVFAIRNGSR